MDKTHMGTIAGIAVFLLVAATVLGFVTAGDQTLDSDVHVSQWIQQWQGALPETLESIGDMSGETITAILVVVGGIALAAIARSWRMMAFLTVVGMLRVMGMVLKPLFDSPRPVAPQVRIHASSDGLGYPSGHSMTAAMIATITVVIIWNLPASVRVRWMVTTLATTLMLLVGWSRVWSGAHWATDVVGGWSYGTGLVLVAWIVTTTIAGSGTWSRWQRSRPTR